MSIDLTLEFNPAILEAAEEMLEQEEQQEQIVIPPTRQPEDSPFALRMGHEFPTAPSEVDRIDVYHMSPGQKPKLVASGKPGQGLVDIEPVVPPALPGTAASAYRHCSCLAVLPGRCCAFCYGTKWTRLCPKCEGEGRVNLVVRHGAERSQPCGNCMGKGILPANIKEVEEARKAAEDFAAGPEGLAMIVDDSAPGFHRSIRLPGIGVTATKRVGTLAARKREKNRNEDRKQKRKSEKSEAAN